MRDISGKLGVGSGEYELPHWEDRWADDGFAVLKLKDELVKRLNGKGGSGVEVRAKL